MDKLMRLRLMAATAHSCPPIYPDLIYSHGKANKKVYCRAAVRAAAWLLMSPGAHLKALLSRRCRRRGELTGSIRDNKATNPLAPPRAKRRRTESVYSSAVTCTEEDATHVHKNNTVRNKRSCRIIKPCFLCGAAHFNPTFNQI